MNDDNIVVMEKDITCVIIPCTKYDDALTKLNDIYYSLLALDNYMHEYLLQRT